MKKSLFVLMLMLCGFAAQAVAQLPSVKLKDINGKVVDTAKLSNEGKPFIITFFAKWCKPCNRELTAINEVYADWQEETGVKNAKLVSDEIFSIETLTVDGHIKKGAYVPCHLHFNVTYLAEADETEALIVKEDENQAVKWFTFEDALEASTEPWMVEHVYKKLVEKSR